ncbi:hypothetical protein GPJ56_008194 [Histomonas meleagridis]|uniref:uncharacterized protein n=1 Tax=Histomonas meleagridis TaxID=135588 RepID=UPI00355A45CE|nr:hypothetical protein GPJ56_008194 [Histomonas meleagridis]KAH0797215.1 hypothetical protein GO595_009897 [Histomonas meleagridis]
MCLSASRRDFYVVRDEDKNKNSTASSTTSQQKTTQPNSPRHYLVDSLIQAGKWEELIQAILELNGSIPSELFSFTCEQLSKIPKSVLITVLDITQIQSDILVKLRKHPSEEEISAIHECFNNVQEHSWVLSQFSNVVPLLPVSVLKPIFESLLDFDKTTVKLPVVKIPPFATEYNINSFPFSTFKKRDDVLPVFLSVLEKSLKRDSHPTKLNIIKDLNQKKINEIRQMLIKVPFHEQHPDNVLSIITSNPKGVFYTLNKYLKKEELVNNYFLPACELELNGDSKQHALKDLSIQMMTDNNLAFEVHKMRQLGGRYEPFWPYLLKKLNENVIHYFIDLEQATLFQKVIDTLKPNPKQTFSLLSFDEAISIITNTINAVFDARESIVQVDVRKYSDLLLRLIPNLWATYRTFSVSSLSAFEGTRDGYRSVLNFIDQDLRDKLIAASVRDPLSDDFADWVKVAGVTALSAPILQLSSPRKTQLIIKDNDVTVDEHCFVTNSEGEKIHLSEYKILTCKFWESKTSLLDDGYEFLLRITMELLIDSLFSNDKEYMKKAIDSHIRMCELLLKVYHSEKESFQMTLLSEVVCTPISMEVGSLAYGSKEYATLLYNKILQRMKFVPIHKVILTLICTSYCEELPHLDETASYVLELVLPYAQSIATIAGIQKNVPPYFIRVYPLNRTDYKAYVKTLVNALSKTKVSHIKIGETSQYQQIEVIDPKILLNYEEIMKIPKVKIALLNNDVELISKILSSPLFSNLIYTIVPQVIYSVKDRILFIKNLLDIAQSSNCKINENGLSSLVKLCLDNKIIGLIEAPQYCIDFITFAANNSNSLIVSQSIFSSVAQYHINLYNIGSTPTNSSKQLCDALEICYSKYPNELTVISGILINRQIAHRAIGMNQIISDMKVDINIDGFSNIKNGSNEWKSLYEYFITKFICQALNSSDSFMVEYAIEILPSINIEASTLQETIIPFIINKLNGNSLLELSEQLFKFCVTLCASSDNSSLIDSFVYSFKSLQNEFNAIAKEQLMTILGNNNPITNVSLEWSRRSTKPYKIIGDTLNEEVVHKFKENKSNDLQRLSSLCKKINETIQPLLVLTDNFVYFKDTINVIGNEHFMNFAKALDNKSEALKHFLVLLGNETKIEFGNEIYNSLKSNFTIEHLCSISKWKNVRTEVKQMVTNEVKKCLSESSADSVLEMFTEISPILFGSDNQQQTRGKVIQVKTTTGRIIDVELEPGMSNAQLVAKIAQVQGIPESEVRVLDQGKQMNK